MDGPGEEEQAKAWFDRLTLGLVHSLEKRVGVVSVKVRPTAPLSSSVVGVWELKHGKLPRDMREFLLTSDGMSLMWTMKHGESVIPAGSLHINPLSEMELLKPAQKPTGLELAAMEQTPTARVTQHEALPFPVLVLDGCNGNNRIGLQLRPDTSAIPPDVWLEDRCGTWHFIANSFTDYFKLSCLHLGLPGWQMAFTCLGLSPVAQSWLSLYAPTRLQMDLGDESALGRQKAVPPPEGESASKGSSPRRGHEAK